MEHTPEPWKVRDYHRDADVQACVGGDGMGWAFVDFDIVGPDDERRIANCDYSSLSGPDCWHGKPNLNTVKANLKRIIDCVNACAGMEDPAKEIEALKNKQ